MNKVCEILLLIYMIFTLGVAKAAETQCDFELTRPAIRFLRTLEGGLAHDMVKVDDVEWMIQQPVPTHPVRKNRVPENLALIQELRRDLSQLKDEQWPRVVQEVGKILSSKQERQQQIQTAKTETSHIFAFRSAGITFQPEEKLLRYFVSRHDTFILSEDRAHTYVTSLRTKEIIQIEDQHTQFEPSSDFFEFSNGEVLFALVSGAHTTVINLSTGKTVFQIPTPPSGGYLPLLFESAGKLNLALGVSGGSHGERLEERAALGPRYRIVYSPEKGVELKSFPLGTSRVVRLKDSHVYGVKFENRTRSTFIHLRDFTLEKDIFDGIELNEKLVKLESALIYSGGPKLLIKPERRNWSSFDSERRILLSTNFIGSKFAFRNLIYPGEEALSIKGAGLPGRHNLKVTSVLGGLPKSVPLPFELDGRIVPEDGPGEPPLVRTEHGPWTYEWEWNATHRTKLHLYNLETEEMMALNVPPVLHKVMGIFREAHTERILMIARDKDAPWKLYTIYGPEAHQISQ